MEPWKEASTDARVNGLLRDVSFLTGQVRTLQDVLAAVIRSHPDPGRLHTFLGAMPPQSLPNPVALEGQRHMWAELKTAFPETGTKSDQP